MGLLAVTMQRMRNGQHFHDDVDGKHCKHDSRWMRAVIPLSLQQRSTNELFLNPEISAHLRVPTNELPRKMNIDSAHRLSCPLGLHGFFCFDLGRRVGPTLKSEAVSSFGPGI